MIDENLSQLSDLAFEGAMAGYLVALMCHAAELAAKRVGAQHRAISGRAGAPGVTRALAMAGDGLPPGGGPQTIHADAAETASEQAGAPSTLGRRLGSAAVAVTAVGFVFHVLALVLRGVAAGRPPWGNMYEFTLMITGAAVAGWLIVLLRNRGARSMGVFVMTPIAVLVFLAGTVLYTRSAPLVPILNSYWLSVHVTAISLSSGVLLLSGLASVAYLYRMHIGADKPSRLPSADRLDRIAYRSAIIAFPFFTFAIVAGALWAEVAWGTYWSWDPKETVTLVTWISFAGYLHARATAGWRGKPAAWISVFGLATIIFDLFFINMVVSGLHSYAGLN
jgi:cytochrome c-type biogenesis protein CcsB